MSDSVKIDCEAVENAISSIRTKLNSDSFAAEYDTLLANITESKGKQAKAGKELIKAEKSMIVAVNQALEHFLDNIQASADKLSTLDKQEADEMYRHNSIKK
jgi:hypothetical protein